MAANYHDRYYRVLVTGFVTENMVTVLFINIGSLAEIAIWDLRWLKKEFLSLPVQSISARLWGIREEEGLEIEARDRLQELTQDGNIDGFAMTLIEVPPLPRRVYTRPWRTTPDRQSSYSIFIPHLAWRCSSVFRD